MHARLDNMPNINVTTCKYWIAFYFAREHSMKGN